MKYSTTKTYTLKRSVIEFGKRIFKGLECVSKSINLEKERGNMQLVR